MGKFIKYDNVFEGQNNWIVAEQEFSTDNLGKFEAILSQGNGYIGLRNSLEEEYVNQVRNMFVAGSYNKAEAADVSELPNFPDLVGVTIKINGKAINLEMGQVKNYKRELNLKTGMVCRQFEWVNQDGITVTFHSERFVSQVNTHLIGSKITVTCDQDVDLKVTSGIEGKVSNSGAQHFENLVQRILGETLQLTGNTNHSKVHMVIHSHVKLSTYKKVLKSSDRRAVFNVYDVALRKSEPLQIEKISMINTSRDIKFREDRFDLERDKYIFLEEFNQVLRKGYDALAKEEIQWWDTFWKIKDVVIKGGNDFEQLAIRFAIYHLNAMTHKFDDRIGIGAKGLSGEGYKGHSFWDTELFILPYFTLTNPDVAHNLLKYRFYNLPASREKAIQLGCEGASFPWEACWYEDGDETPENIGVDINTGELTEVLMKTIEIHITADISYAVWQYYQATHDELFMQDYGNKIIIETALFWATKFVYVEENNRYEIFDVIGPDEYTEHVDNNTYTNYLAVYNMKCAIRVIDKLLKEGQTKLDELDLNHVKLRCENVVEKAYLPEANADGIIYQYDRFEDKKDLDITPYKMAEEVMTIYNDYSYTELSDFKLSKQADFVMLMYLLQDLFDEETKVKNFNFHEAHCLHDSSLSKCMHTIVASDLGLNEIAKELYEGSLHIDLGTNMKSSNSGIHAASMGGIYLATVSGFGGVKITEKGLVVKPNLPQSWESLNFHLNYKNCDLEFNLTHQGSQILNHSNQEVSFEFNGEIIKSLGNDQIER